MDYTKSWLLLATPDEVKKAILDCLYKEDDDDMLVEDVFTMLNYKRNEEIILDESNSILTKDIFII